MFSPLLPSELQSPPDPVDWIVENFIARGALSLLAGEGGLGKSLLALAFASAVRNVDVHSNYAGLGIDYGPIAYVDSENGRGEIHRRANSFRIFEYIYQYDGDLLEELSGLQDVAHQVKRGMIVLDSFRSLFPSVEEKDDKQVMWALKGVQDIARAYEVGILILHHTSKSGVYRGSTEFQNRPDIVCTIRRDKGYGARLIEWNKMRIGLEPPERHHLRITNTDGTVRWEHVRPAPTGEDGDFDLF